MSKLLHAVFSKPTSKIDLTFDNKLVITFPSSKIPFLKGQEQHNIDDIVLQNKGSVLYWPEIDKNIALEDLLKLLLGD